MIKKIFLALTILIAGSAAIFSNGNIVDIFPDIESWTRKGEPQSYTPDTLFEYINGAAEVFLSYDFQKLATLTYTNEQKHSFTVDIYLHGSRNDGFGIYSQERPNQGEFLSIGTHGYYEKGVLNFFKDRYYVKISSFDLGENDRGVLTSIARMIARKLEGKTEFPTVLSCFPDEKKIPHSERYIARNFLGHKFLHSAFVAEYAQADRTAQIFIMEAGDEATAGNIINNYRSFVEAKGMKISEIDGIIQFSDPYYRSSGPMHLKRNGRYVWGLFSPHQQTAHIYIKEIEKNLKKRQLAG